MCVEVLEGRRLGVLNLDVATEHVGIVLCCVVFTIRLAGVSLG